MPDIRLRYHQDMLVVAPLFTRHLLDSELDGSECLEYFNILDDELVRETHRRFRLAGAHCTATNTLKANRVTLQAYGLEDALVDINRMGVKLAREVGFEHVLATVEYTEPEVLSEQIAALLPEHPDAIWLVGEGSAQGSDNEVRSGDMQQTQLAAALSCIREQTNLPIIAALSAAELLSSADDIDIIYSMGKTPKACLEELSRAAERFDQPLMACPDPGTPQGITRQQQSAMLGLLTDKMVTFALEARSLGAHGVQFVGIAPGGLPVFTGSVAAALFGKDVVTAKQTPDTTRAVSF